jgi:manganese efflux pump family protein
MSFSEILLLALGLAMDATAVSAARGLSLDRVSFKHVARVALLFGGFQAGMPLVGWGLGALLGPLIRAWAHWVAFVLLGGLGGKMLWEACKPVEASSDGDAPNEQVPRRDPFAFGAMLTLAVATSIDALAAGIPLPLISAPMFLTLTTIGITTAALSTMGLFAGRHLGATLGKKLDIFGGSILVLLGLKALLEHFLK